LGEACSKGLGWADFFAGYEHCAALSWKLLVRGDPPFDEADRALVDLDAGDEARVNATAGGEIGVLVGVGEDGTVGVAADGRCS
jgi:hypothetical protein